MSTNSLVKTSCISVVLALIGLVGIAQPVANFSANPLSGCSPMVVSFTDQSTGSPTQWRWDLGNGTISFLQNPSVTYFSPGLYTVKLVVQNAVGIDSLERIQYITIYSQPTVNFTASPVSGCFPLPIQFNDLSTPGSGTIVQWEWDFGDGNASTLQHPSHVYTSAGNYNVSLRVTNSNGCSQTITRLQYIHISNGVIADFTNTIPNSCNPPVNITFSNLSTGTGALSYSWDFGDGTTSNQTNPSHSYNNPGTYNVMLIVTNSTGCKDTLIRANAITIGNVNADFNIPDSICISQPFTLSNTSAPAPLGALWSFGDGTFSTALNPVKFYSTAGIYQIKLVSNFGACIDSTIKQIVVVDAPQSSFMAIPASGCQAPLTVTFNNNSLNYVSTLWDLGDGNTSTQVSPVHTYTVPGSYTITLYSTNAFGCTDTLVMPDHITLALPVVTIDNLPVEGCAPLAVSLSATINSLEPVTSYLWDLGDGNTSTLANPTHIYAVGVYNISLIITTASGCSDTSIVLAGVSAGIKPQANFSASPLDVCAMTTVNFTDLSTGIVNQWLWNFGDGGTSGLQNPNYMYQDTGYFDIQLIAGHNGCRDTLIIPNYIHVSPPISIFNIDLDCGDPAKRTFTDLSIGADTWTWDFGDGNTSAQQSPVHQYAAPGSYTITLSVTNVLSGCTHVSTQQTLIILETTDFTATDTIICRNTSIDFNAGTASANILSYDWTFGDGVTASGPAVSHSYAVSGTYNVSLITTNVNGCSDTLTKVNYIRVNGPVANFGVQSIGTCSMSAVPLSDSSLTDGIHSITTWVWNYGDGNIETLNTGPFQHTYSAPGIYTISLTVTDTEGCTDSITLFSLLTISQPIANFSTSDTAACPGRPVTFTNMSSGPSLSYSWDFGDGNTSTNANPIHNYASDGIYNVQLIIVDQFGCSDTLIRNNYIVVTTPHAVFSASDTLGTCPPLVVNFTNSSDNYTSLNWDFGDGTSSQSANPSHFYSTPGIYNAVLTVNGAGGCSSVHSQTITVRGPQGSFTYSPLSGCDSLTVNFVATTRDRLSFIWDFNDGTTLTTIDSIISHTYTSQGNYVPKMILLDSTGCLVPITGADTISVNGAIATFNFNTQPLCDAGNVQFNNTTSSVDGILSYTWDFGDGSGSALSDPLHYYSAPGIYQPTLSITTILGCTASVSGMPVKVVASPQGLITQSADGCTPLSVTFNGSLAVADTSSIAWNWNFGNGHSSDLQVPPAEIYTVNGNYNIILLLTNSSGCIDTVTSSVNAFLVPTISAGLDTSICQGTGTTLHASGAQTYIWDAIPGLSCYNCADPVALPDSMTKYFVTGTTSQGCTNIDSVIVSVRHPFSMLDSGPDTLCIGSSVRLQASGAYSYSWSPSTGLNSTTSASPMATPYTTTTYQVIGTDDRNCFTDTAYIPVRVYPIPTVEAGDDITINVGQMTDLMPVISSDVNQVNWSPTGSIFRTIYPGITVKPRETTTFQVEVMNQGGCRTVDFITVHVICNGANVFIPNTFSPNNDGANDVFFPRGTGLFSIKTARIFNRWGEVVYERSNFQANDATSGWDGTYKGQKLNPDVYVYAIEILCDNNTTLPFKGNVALIK